MMCPGKRRYIDYEKKNEKITGKNTLNHWADYWCDSDAGSFPVDDLYFFEEYGGRI